MPAMSPRVAAAARSGVAIGLLYESLGAAVRVGRIISFYAVYDATVFVMAGLRAVVTALAVAAVVMLFAGRPGGPTFGRTALGSSAVLMFFEVGLALSPSSVPPGQRWLTVAAYWGYAALASWLLRRTANDR